MEFTSPQCPADAPTDSSTFVRREPVDIPDDWNISKESYYVPSHYKPFVDYLLITKGTIVDRTEKLAVDISQDYEGKTVHLMCVLKGGSTFFKELCDALSRIHQYSSRTYVPFTFDFIRVKSYDGTESTGKVKISGCDVSKLRGKHVIFVEDIIDTGLTMSSLMEFMNSEIQPASVRVAALVEKRTVRSCGFKGNYIGFSVPDKFIVGYCLDYNEAYRDLGHIGVINGAGIEKYRDFENM